MPIFKVKTMPLRRIDLRRGLLRRLEGGRVKTGLCSGKRRERRLEEERRKGMYVCRDIKTCREVKNVCTHVAR
jgi:hypothetical protein